VGKIVLCPDAWKIPPPTFLAFVCRTCLASTNDDKDSEVFGKGPGAAGGDDNFSGGTKEVEGLLVDEVTGVTEVRKPLEVDFGPGSGIWGEEGRKVCEDTL